VEHLVFVHGGGVGPWMWRGQRAHFEDKYRIHTPVLPGHDPEDRSGYTSHAEAAQSIAEQIGLAHISGEITVIGFSLGGQVAIVFADMFPEKVARTAVISSLVTPWRTARVLSSIAGLAAPLSRLETFARRQARELYIGADDFDEYFVLTSRMKRSTLVEMMRANLSFFPPRSFMDDERAALFVAGSEEQRSLIAGLRHLSEALPGGRFDQINGVGHGAPMAKADELNRVLERWLASTGS
jgi:pimeloyl-ACP methyl ester carboxylesterase